MQPKRNHDPGIHMTPEFKTRTVADQSRYQRMTTAELRESFLIDTLFQTGAIDLVYTDVDRAIVGSVVPASEKLALGTSKSQLAADYFAERREIGIINTGAEGTIAVDGKSFNMENCDGLYIGRGSKQIEFASKNPSDPARYFLISYPAHTAHPTTHAKKSAAEAVNLGQLKDANQRTIYKYIHPK